MTMFDDSSNSLLYTGREVKCSRWVGREQECDLTKVTR